jgi:hypothetical protein
MGPLVGSGVVGLLADLSVLPLLADRAMQCIPKIPPPWTKQEPCLLPCCPPSPIFASQFVCWRLHTVFHFYPLLDVPSHYHPRMLAGGQGQHCSCHPSPPGALPISQPASRVQSRALQLYKSVSTGPGLPRNPTTVVGAAAGARGGREAGQVAWRHGVAGNFLVWLTLAPPPPVLQVRPQCMLLHAALLLPCRLLLLVNLRYLPGYQRPPHPTPCPAPGASGGAPVVRAKPLVMPRGLVRCSLLPQLMGPEGAWRGGGAANWELGPG